MLDLAGLPAVSDADTRPKVGACCASVSAARTVSGNFLDWRQPANLLGRVQLSLQDRLQSCVVLAFKLGGKHLHVSQRSCEEDLSSAPVQHT